jgi:hypothetical protein
MEALYDIIERLNEEVREYIISNMKEVGAAELDLDPRAGRVYVNEDGIAIHNNRKSSLEYYGGFEYISRECVETVGNYTFYLSDHDRVLECITAYLEKSMENDQVVMENDYFD